VVPDFGHETEVGPFHTYKEACDFAIERCQGQAQIKECKNMRLISSEEITNEEFERIKNGLNVVTDPDDFTAPEDFRTRP
jgi:hypothetical protein